MVQNGHMASPGPLGKVSGGPQRVHGVSLDGHESSCEGLYGPEWSPGALGKVSGGPERGSLEVFRGCMGSPGTVLRGLVRVSGGPERVHGVPKLEILSFLQPLWCDLHVFQGPTWDSMPGSKWLGEAYRRTCESAGGP